MNLRKINKNQSNKNLLKYNKKIRFLKERRVFKGRSKYRFLIDIRSTLSALKQSLLVIEQISKDGGNILVVGTRKEYKQLLFNYGKETGHPFFIRWVNGALTNWTVFSDYLQKYDDRLDTLKLLDWQRKKFVIEFLRKNQGMITNSKKPNLVIFINPQDLLEPVNEACVAEIPSMGLLSTKGNPHTLTYPIPANDNSIEAVGLFLMLVKIAIKVGEKKRKIALQKKSLIKKSSSSNSKKRNKSNFKRVKGKGNKKKFSKKAVKKQFIKNKKK